MTDEEICARLYRDLCDASVRKDADGIAAVLADDYALVHMTGMRQPKSAYIAAGVEPPAQPERRIGANFIR